MWQYIKNQLPLFAIIVILWCVLGQMYKKMNVYKSQSDTLEMTVNDLNQAIKYTKLQLNDSLEVYQAEVRNLLVTRDNLKYKYDNLLKESELRSKDVQSVTEITNVVKDKDTVIAEVDSFGGLKARLEDNFVKIEVDVFADRRTIIDYEVRDSLTLINVCKRHSWLFGLIKWNEHTSTRVISNNPKSRIVNLQTMEVFDK